jgi:hypothetical protein
VSNGLDAAAAATNILPKIKNHQTKGDDRVLATPGNENAAGVRSVAGLEKVAVLGNGAQFAPKTKLARWT